MILSWTGQGCGQQFRTQLTARPATKLKTTLKTSVVPGRFCKSTTLLIAQVAWTSPATASPYSESIFFWKIWSKYLPTPGMLFYILSPWRLGSICRGLECYSISYQALAVSALAWHLQRLGCSLGMLLSIKAWYAILYLIMPWQYQQRLGMLFYILLCLSSICLGLACYSMSCHSLAVSA